MEGRWRPSRCFGWVSLPGHERQVVVKEQQWLCQGLVAFSFPIPAWRVPEHNSTSGLLSPTPPALSAVYTYLLPSIKSPLLKILGAFSTMNPNWCMKVLLQGTRAEREARQETREELVMSCHNSFTHACVHSMIHQRRHLLSLYYVPGTVSLLNGFNF